MNSRSLIIGFVAAAAIACSAPAKAETAIATRWKLTGEAQGDCMNHARIALSNVGFGKTGSGSQSMSGKQGDYTASIRCVSEQNIVFFVLSGPSSGTADRYLDSLYGGF